MAIQSEVKDIVVIGGGGHARVVISILRKLPEFKIQGYTDLRDRGLLLGTAYIGTDIELAALGGSQSLNGVLAVGQIGLGKSRQELWSRLASLRLAFPKVISPAAIVNEAVEIGEGVTVMDGTIINTGAKLGVGVIANSHSTVEHDVTLEDWVHVAPGATILGGVTVGRYSMIGAGATIIEGRTIASEVIVGAGATVVHDLSEPGVYVGTPARRMR